MGSSLLWVKACTSSRTSWFAALFYLPRFFVNLASVPADSHAERERLLVMARKLYRFSSLLMIPAVGLGLLLWLGYGVGKGPGNYWLHAKIVLVVAAIGYHHACGSLLKRFDASPTSAASAGTGSSTNRRCCCSPSSSCWSSSSRSDRSREADHAAPIAAPPCR